MITSPLFRSLIAASFLSTLALNYFGWKIAEFMPDEHIHLLDWQGYFSIIGYESLRNLNIIIIIIEIIGILGMIFEPRIFRNVLLFSMTLWVIEGLVGGYFVATPLVTALSEIQKIFISLTLGFAYFSNKDFW
ncbi:hypothetical protein [Vreelandella boliviensis]|uniref:hypothetical protein n=1 Tax=Vreelandella boliviensis TaxID=223527 RepID=UPI001B8B1F18|nr:hypothetical protein [Halomonas boliviensis]MBS3667631.1 hypothetical protein [Halomonas boliviensis]